MGLTMYLDYGGIDWIRPCVTMGLYQLGLIDAVRSCMVTKQIQNTMRHYARKYILLIKKPTIWLK